jgi:hypothetical protein
MTTMTTIDTTIYRKIDTIISVVATITGIGFIWHMTSALNKDINKDINKDKDKDKFKLVKNGKSRMLKHDEFLHVFNCDRVNDDLDSWSTDSILRAVKLDWTIYKVIPESQKTVQMNKAVIPGNKRAINMVNPTTKMEFFQYWKLYTDTYGSKPFNLIDAQPFLDAHRDRLLSSENKD